jgi:hypothetical protein
MIFEVVVGVAQETPAAFGLALERPAPWPRPPARVARERSVEPEVGLPSSPDPCPGPAKEKPCPPPCLWHLPRSFPHLLPQSEYNQGLKDATPVLEAALRWLAARTPGSAESLRLMDATPIGCGRSTTTTHRSDLVDWAGYGYESAHSRWYWGVKLLLITTPDDTVTGFSLANPKLAGEREQTRQTLTRRPVNRPAPGSIVVTDKSLAGADVEEFFAGLDLTLLRPARRDEKTPRPFPSWLRQRIRSDHLDLEEPTRPRTTHRARPRRAVDPHPATPPGPQRRDLAQLDHRRTRQTLPDRLRPLTV